MRTLHNEYGNTFQASPLRRTTIYTIDVENVRSLLATDTGSYEAGDRRFDIVGPLIGRSVFTTDGHIWKGNRAEVKPSFMGLQAKDLGYLEKHVDALMERVNEEGEGRGFDMAPMLAEMVCLT